MSEGSSRFEERAMRRGRPGFAGGYGVNLDEEGMLTLDWVRQRVKRSINYWIVSTRPDGRPHASPVWGIWLEDALCFGTGRSSRKGRNLATNPALVVHLESGDEVVILEGIAEELTDRPTLQRYANAYEAKYAIRPEIDDQQSNDVTYRLWPDVVLAWTEPDFLTTPARWEFERS
jgi:Pyridoxamine 5'-phosphate oxidase